MKMRMKTLALSVTLAMGIAGMASPAFAGGVPVIDAAAIAEAIKQFEQLNKQLDTMGKQLSQAQQLNQSLTGGRGMEQLLANEARNVIPTNWQETLAQMNGGGKISDLAKQIKEAASKIDTATLDRLAPQLRDTTVTLANTAASEQAAAGTAYDNASSRFARLQALMGEIPKAADMKAVADLQARIQVESVMLQNETIKMAALAQASAAQRRIEERQAAEMGVRRSVTVSFDNVVR